MLDHGVEGEMPPEADTPSWLTESIPETSGTDEVQSIDFSTVPEWLVDTPMAEVEDEAQVDEEHEQREWIDRIRFYYHLYNQQYQKLKRLFEGAQDQGEKEKYLERILRLRNAAGKYFKAMNLIERLGTNPELLPEAIKIYNEGVVESRDAELPLSYPAVVRELFKDSTIGVDYEKLIDELTEAYIVQSTNIERVRSGEVSVETLRNQVLHVFTRLNNVIPADYVPFDPELKNRDVFIARLTMVVLKDQPLLDIINELKRYQLNKLFEKLREKVSNL